MLKLLIVLLISVITLSQELVKIELLQRFQVSINEPNKFKYFYVDIGEQLTPEDEALVIQPDGGNNGIHYYTQKDRIPTHDDHDVSEYLFHQRFVLRRDTNVKRLYFGFYTRSNGTASNTAVVFKVKTNSPTLKSGAVPLKLEFKKSYIGTFKIERPVPHDFSLLIETNDPIPNNLYLVRQTSFVPNELWNRLTYRMDAGVNIFSMNESSIHLGFYAKQDVKIELFYSHKLSYIQGNYVGKKIRNIEHFSMKRKDKKQTIALISKGKEMKLYLNHGNGNVQNPDANNHQHVGKQIFGLSGYWGSIIEVDNLQENLKIGVENGEVDQQLFLLPQYRSTIEPRGNYYPTITTITPGKGITYTVRSTDFGPFNFKIDVSLQKKSKVKVTQIKNGVSSELINTDQDFKLEIGMNRRDLHTWIIEGDNTLLIRAGEIF